MLISPKKNQKDFTKKMKIDILRGLTPSFLMMIFTVYSKDGCPYCTKVQQVLELAEIDHVIYKLNRDYTREEFYDKFGQGSTFPRVVKDNELIGGCTETVKYLREQKLV